MTDDAFCKMWVKRASKKNPCAQLTVYPDVPPRMSRIVLLDWEGDELSPRAFAHVDRSPQNAAKLLWRILTGEIL